MSNYQELCDGILGIDKKIRYVGLADHLGTLVARAYRPGLVPLSSKEETEKYTMQAIQRTGAIMGGTKVGKLQYVIGRYENLVRATVPVISDRQDKFYLMISLDLGCEPFKIIEDEVLPHVEQSRKWL